MRTLTLAVSVTSLLVLAAGLAAQGSPAPEGAGASTGAQAAVVRSEPVAVPAADARTMAYYRSDNLVRIGNYVTAVLVSVLVLFTGLSARMRDFAWKVGRFWALAIAVYLVLFAAIDFLLSLPLGYYEFARDRRYGLSQDSFGTWLGDGLLELLGGIIFVTLVMIALYTMMRLSPRRWWLYVAIVLFILQAGGHAVGVWMASQGKGFGPVENPALAADLQALAAHAGVPEAGIYQAAEVENGAMVSGWLGGPRIVVEAPGESRLSREQRLFLVGRELGAYRLKQEMKYFLVRSLLSIVSFYLIYRVSSQLIARFKDRFGFDRLSDFASWPLFPALFNIFFLLVKPVDAAYSRHLKHEADLFAVELVQDNRACAQSFLALGSTSGALVNPDPGPVYRFLGAFDPPLADRIEFCNTYRPWERNEPLKYGELLVGEQPGGGQAGREQ